MAFPTTLDDLDATRGTATQALNSPSHVTHHTLEDDTLEAIQTKLGVDSSAVATTIDYLLKNTSSSNPGHKHTLANGATDVTATAAELNYVGGVTSAIQTQINTKQATLTNSAGLLAALSDETGTGLAVFNTAPTLTSPLFQGTVDGWISANETWTYASASTITVPAGAASKYAVGDRIKWTQTTVKYGVIVTVADTLLTIAVNTDYTVTNAAITLNYYSHEASPIGYPTWFNYAPSVTWTNGPTTTTDDAKFKVEGASCTVVWDRIGTANASTSTIFTVSLPINYSYTGSIRHPCGSGHIIDTTSKTIVTYIPGNAQNMSGEFAAGNPTYATIWSVYPI